MNEYTFEEWESHNYIGSWSEIKFKELHVVRGDNAAQALEQAKAKIAPTFFKDCLKREVRNLQKIS